MKAFEHFKSPTTPYTLPYLLTRPEGSEGEALPLIVCLHGAGERGDSEQVLCVHGVPRYFSANAEHGGIRAVTLSPQCPQGDIWSNFPSVIMELILHVAHREGVDMNRISITGLSMGGFGTWSMLAQFPNFFSAAAPICGGGVSWYINTKTPIRAFHGDKDDVVPLIYSQLMVDAVNSRGGNATLKIFEGCDHGSWEPAYEQTDVLAWLAAAKRD